MKKIKKTSMRYSKEEIENYISKTIAYFKTIDKKSDENYFKWAENEIRKILYKKYKIREVV